MDSDSNDEDWVIGKVEELAASLGLPPQHITTHSVDEIDVGILLEIFERICNPPVNDDSTSASSDEVSLYKAIERMLMYIKGRYGSSKGEFDHLKANLIAEKDPTQIKFLVQVLDLIHDHKFKSRRPSRKSSKSSSTSLSSLPSSSNGMSGGETTEDESMGASWNVDSHSTEEDSTNRRDSAFERSLDTDHTQSTVDEVFINVFEESEPSADDDSLLAQTVKSIRSLKTPIKIDSSSIEFDKEQMLMIRQKTNNFIDLDLSASTVNTSETEREPEYTTSESQENVKKYASDSKILQKSTAVATVDKISSKTNEDPSKNIFVRRTDTRILFGPNASKANRPNLNKQSALQSRHNSQPSIISSALKVETTQESSLVPSVLIDRVDSNSERKPLEESKLELDSPIAIQKDEQDVKENNEGKSLLIMNDSLEQQDNARTESEGKSKAENEQLSELCRKKPNGELRDFLLNNLDCLEQILEHYCTKCVGPDRKKSRLNDIESQNHVLKTPGRKRFPYYPYGIIIPKCQSIMGKSRQCCKSRKE